LDDDYRNDYWQEVVEAVKAKRVIPIHWDDFTLSLDQPLVPMSNLFDDFDKTMGFLLARGRQKGIDVKILPAWVKVDPFANI
jgi:L-ascorbate metabolism protein UlaG (beta-lactamase superfamily)